MHRVALGAGALFCMVAVLVLLGWTDAVDHAVSLAVHRLDTPLLDRVMLMFSTIGSFSVVASVAAGVALWSVRVGDLRAALALPLTIAAKEAATSWLKHVFLRPRPTLFTEIATPLSYSFPSGHAMGAVASWGIVAMVMARLFPVCRRAVIGGWLALAPMIGLSRIYLGVHWLSDVVAGYAAGAVILCIALLFLDPERPKQPVA